MLWPLADGGVDALGSAPSFMPWQLLTYAFLHGSFMHVVFNMFALGMFGAPLEYTWGNKRFLEYYLVCVVGAGVCQLMVGWWQMQQGGDVGPAIGASGGVFGLLLAYGMLFPNQRVMLLFPPIPMKARTLVIVYGVIELFLGVCGFAARRRAFRAPGRDVVWLVADPLLARTTAVRQRGAATATDRALPQRQRRDDQRRCVCGHVAVSARVLNCRSGGTLIALPALHVYALPKRGSSSADH